MHARILAIALWSTAAVWPFLGTGMRDPAGHLRGVDFINFYTMGVLARTGRVSEIYDLTTFHRLPSEIKLAPVSQRQTRHMPLWTTPAWFIVVNVLTGTSPVSGAPAALYRRA